MLAGQQVPLLGRDIPSVKAFKGTVTFAGRHQGTECSLVAPENANGKVPVSSTYLAPAPIALCSQAIVERGLTALSAAVDSLRRRQLGL